MPLTIPQFEDFSQQAQGGATSGAGGLLRERGQIHSATASADEVLAQAQATKTALSAQRGLFVEIGAKMKHLGDRFPVIRTTLSESGCFNLVPSGLFLSVCVG